MWRISSRVVFWWFVIGWMGCGPARQPGVEVNGTVQLDGQPLAQGSVVFVPVNGTRGPKCYALVEQGRFHLPEAQGPFPGTYRVEVYSAVQLRVPLEGIEESVVATFQQPPVASRFNTESQLMVNIAPGVPAKLNLEVSSEAAPPASGSSPVR